ncbi:MAG: thiolase family protein [Proteobacteria bacterium]|nr:thiolase family protein [Pseudomonadota bacterium]MBT6465116.1 thiolase family protein [Pseudomonadota bacterium]MBT7246255.1 thiolase family protein [Pseudomonadota bacterium]MBT7562317.1 thiolase family protein [Pseudomonadota bacterium]MBT7625938.1 thiolase family protein [Pseudomonadota bacterium]
MRDVHIAGVSMTKFGKFLDKSLKDLTGDALYEVLKDAGCNGNSVEAAFFGNCVQGHMEGQDMVRGEIALRPFGIEGIPVVNVENACATASTAFHMAVNYVKAGAADVVLAIGVEKMFSEDKARMFSAFDGAWDVHEVEKSKSRFDEMAVGVEIPEGTTSPRPYSVFMDIYAGFCRMHMREFGTTQEQLAMIASKNHEHSVQNIRSQYNKSFSVEEVLAAAPITYPLTLPMCSPVSDGAAAAIVCSDAGLKRLELQGSRATKVLASVLRGGSDRDLSDFSKHASRLAALTAYEQAGVGPEDIDVAEVHDATAMGEVMEVEALGLCELGGGGPMAENGDSRIGGRLPVNPSGGLESKGHPIGATGLGQIYELVTQLRGESGQRQVDGARIAIAQNGGGIVGIEEAVTAITILGG